jgi:hypothetical protein
MIYGCKVIQVIKIILNKEQFSLLACEIFSSEKEYLKTGEKQLKYSQKLEYWK